MAEQPNGIDDHESGERKFEPITLEQLELLVDRSMDLIGIDEACRDHEDLRDRMRHAVALTRLTVGLSVMDPERLKDSGYWQRGEYGWHWQDLLLGIRDQSNHTKVDQMRRGAPDEWQLNLESVTYLVQPGNLEAFITFMGDVHADKMLRKASCFCPCNNDVKAFKIFKEASGEHFVHYSDVLFGRAEKYDDTSSMPQDLYEALSSVRLAPRMFDIVKSMVKTYPGRHKD